ncbi:hypothetical protein Tco_0544004 [Tanacetum coccineum]
MQPVALPSPNYVPGPEHQPSPNYESGPEHPPSPVEVSYVPEPEYPEYLVPSDVEAPLEDHPLPADASPTNLSPGYMADSDPDEDPKEDPEEDHTDYSADGGDGDDEPSDDDDDDADINDEDEEPFEDGDDDEEEEEHLASADSSVVPVVDLVPSARDTEAFETDESAPTPRTDIPEAEMPPRKRACFTTPTPELEIGESLAAGAARQPRPTMEADTWDEIVEDMMEVAPTTLEGVEQRVTELDTIVSFEDMSAAIEAHVRTLEAQVATLIAQTSSLQT